MEFVITEGVEGYWHYHISHKDKFIKSLCGKDTMMTELTFSSWGFIGHLKERYCKECYQKYQISQIKNQDKRTFRETES